MTRIRISIPPRPAIGYDVLVRPGSSRELPNLLVEAAPAPHYAVVTDSTVAKLVAGEAHRALLDAGMRAELIEFPAGERNKTRESWAVLSDALLERGFGRDGCVVGVGGGVTGDLAGFVAATYMRGVALVQVPTSLLAMLDASVGGKTGVDTRAGKNLVGAFHQPRLVVIDPSVLGSLPETELRSGLAEAVKHGAIADPAYLEWIAGSAGALFAREDQPLAELVRRSVEVKANVVAADVEEAGRRKVLNFGHTIGHALEALSGYGLAHGYAVALGMVAEAEAGEAAGITEPGTAETVRRTLAALELPVRLPAETDPAAVVVQARRDKKSRRGKPRYTLLKRPGEVACGPDGDWTFPLDDALVAGVLTRLLT